MRRLMPICLALRCLSSPVDLAVSVVDESGTPVAGAAVSADTVPRSTLDPWNAPARSVRVEAAADGKGVARLVAEHALPRLVVSAVAPGFHPAARVVERADRSVRLVLPRRLGAVSSVRLELLTRLLPDDGAEHGFDLALGAFMPPLGVGRRADVYLSGRCPSARLPRSSPGAYVDEVRMRFDAGGAGVVAVPRPGQLGFAGSVSSACEGMLLPAMDHPREAPEAGYEPLLVYRSARADSPGAIPGPGRAGAPQWIFRVNREGGPLHGVIADFGWLPDGRLRLVYRISTEVGCRSLEFGP